MLRMHFDFYASYSWSVLVCIVVGCRNFAATIKVTFWCQEFVWISIVILSVLWLWSAVCVRFGWKLAAGVPFQVTKWSWYQTGAIGGVRITSPKILATEHDRYHYRYTSSVLECVINLVRTSGVDHRKKWTTDIGQRSTSSFW